MNSENNKISTPFHWSGSVVTITILVLIVLVMAVFTIEIREWPLTMLWQRYLLRIIFLATIVITFGFMPMRLEANDEKLTISRLFGSIEIPMSEITEARIIPKSKMGNSIRIFGSGGLFGYLGKFRSASLGTYTMYATDMNHLFLIRTRNKKYVFSCSCCKELIEYVNTRLELKCSRP